MSWRDVPHLSEQGDGDTGTEELAEVFGGELADDPDL